MRIGWAAIRGNPLSCPRRTVRGVRFGECRRIADASMPPGFVSSKGHVHFGYLLGCYRMRRTLASMALAYLIVSITSQDAWSGHKAPSAAGTVRVEYRKPTNPAHEALYVEMRERGILERFATVLSVFHLPRALTLAFASCGGDSNAWYDPETTTVFFCYEYLADIRRLAASENRGEVSLTDASDGPAGFIMLHESGHAVFDLLKVPILGREEDAADTFAAVILLRLGQGLALRTIRGAAWAYAQGAAARTPDEGDFADAHGLDAQRYYNIVCLAYGSDPTFFASVVTDRHLPADRAESCTDEYHQALLAVQKLILPSVSAEKLQRLRIKYKKDLERRE